jgi:hypothetical protein
MAFGIAKKEKIPEFGNTAMELKDSMANGSPGTDLSKEFGTLMTILNLQEHGDMKIAHFMELGSTIKTIHPSSMTTPHMKKRNMKKYAKTWKVIM